MAIVTFGAQPLDLADVVAIADGRATVALSDDPAFRARLRRSREVLEAHLAAGRRVYGVTTGVGESVRHDVVVAEQLAMARNVMAMHGCGTGEILSVEAGRAVLAARIAALVRGGSAVRECVVEGLVAMLAADVIPAIPSEGSVGASGDLTPLSYVAAVLSGDREAWWRGEVRPAAEALAEAGLTPLALEPKEPLAIMNGTSVMTGLACLALARADRLVRLGAVISAMALDVTGGNAEHVDARLFAAKPHPGQARVAAWMADHLAYDPATHVPPSRLQDRYSIRCAPHVIGVLEDALPFLEGLVRVELNGVNDNPVVDPDEGAVLHGGNFYGGHVGFAMDALKLAVASCADLHDRQLALLVDPVTSGLPENLVVPLPGERAARHGFKALLIAASALAAEALKLTMPATAFSRSTESHNQDKVSMGTIAARDALRVLELSERVLAIELLAVCQGVDLRGPEACRAASVALRDAVRAVVPGTVEDRRHDLDLARLVDALRSGAIPLPAR